MNNNGNIGQRINSALAKRGKKQKELAAAIGVQDNTISYFCSGARTPNAQQIIGIAKYLHVSTDYLLGLSTAMDFDTTIQEVCKYTGLSQEAVEALSFDSQQHRNGLFDIEDYLIREFYLSFFAKQVYKSAKAARLCNQLSQSGLGDHWSEGKDFETYRFQKVCVKLLSDIINNAELPIPDVTPDKEAYLRRERETYQKRIERIDTLLSKETDNAE